LNTYLDDCVLEELVDHLGNVLVLRKPLLQCERRAHTVGRRYTHALASQLAADASSLGTYLDGATEGKVVPLAVAAVAS
jgi:hypothetical protein